jgi:hypothetical protein
MPRRQIRIHRAGQLTLNSSYHDAVTIVTVELVRRKKGAGEIDVISESRSVLVPTRYEVLRAADECLAEILAVVEPGVGQILPDRASIERAFEPEMPAWAGVGVNGNGGQ